MGMHLETVYRFLQRKELRSVKTGRTYRVKPEWCDAFLMGENQWAL
ncbi:excisionase family DNA-binding protein [Corynebacterium kefirresidentii]|nr:excisionase family DNA-binding protein [Corynebacterium kefirresidentii]